VETRLDQVVVVPRNGYVNRLQAWASSAILAAQLDVPLRVMWETEEPAPAAPADLFDAAVIARSFWERSRLDALLGGAHEELPRYLTHDRQRDLIVLAGHDRGEEVFMGQLAAMLLGLEEPTTLVIIAGGKFHLPTDEDFTRQRAVFYRQLAWHPDLNRRMTEELTDHPDYVALHVRGTDRSLEAPTARAIRDGLTALAGSTDERSLFIAADSPASRDRWADEAAVLGFSPWSAQAVDHDRSHAAAGLDAMLDWRLLGRSQALVYTAASSFGEEAAVATGNVGGCFPLSATASRQRARIAAQLGRAAATYPRRKGWWGSSEG
jgi:hypothetical protein